MGYVLGLDIGGTKSAVLLANAGQEGVVFLERETTASKSCWQEVLDTLLEQGERMLKKHKVSGDECRAGISCGGPLDSSKGLILSPPNLPGWDEVPVRSYVKKRLHMEARLMNDADACALAEWKYGAGRGCRHMIFLTFGTGLGAGLILNGQLYEGACNMAGEAGHIRLEEHGPVGYGKAGSFEGFCSGGGIAQMAMAMAEKALKEGRGVSYLKGRPIQEISARDVALEAEKGMEDALEVLACSGRYFGRGLAVLIDLLNPERIVAGSIFARSGKFLVEEMERELRKETLSASLAACTIVPAKLGEQIGDYGAVVAAMEGL